MRVREPGKIRDGLWMLGSEESSVYVAEGKEGFILINGGMSYLAPTIIRQFDEFGIDESQVRSILILHAHFDHVGIVPFFKRRRPDLRILASARACEIFRNPKAARTIDAFSLEVARRMGKARILEEYDLSWSDDIEGTAVSEGDTIDLGGTVFRIYETPGHSSCCIAAYLQGSKALFASDGAGIPFKDILDTSPSYDYALYLHSLARLKELEVEYICADHYGYVTGDEAGDFLNQTILACKKERVLMEETYLRTRDVKSAAEEWVNRFLMQNPEYLLTPAILTKVNEQIFKHLADDLEGTRS